MDKISYISYDSTGLNLFDGGPKNFGACSNAFQPVQDKVKFFITSKNGSMMAWIANGEVHVVEAPEWKKIGTLKHPKAQEVCFSPQGTYIAVFDTYARNIGEAAVPNISIYSVDGRKLVYAYLLQTQFQWQPQWTGDETIVARQQTSEVMFYASDNFDTTIARKQLAKVRSFSLSQSKNNHYVVFFVPCIKDSPAYVHLYKYPDFRDSSQALANKSFYQVDTVEYFWNQQSSAVLILTSAPPDKTGTSYYGDQMLFYLSTRGDSNRVTFDKNGNIRSVCWCPSGKEFVAVYGSAPSRATLFNNKCDPVKNFGDGSRNIVSINPPGNIVMIAALGNISSRFEFWDLANTKLIKELECPDITHMEWSPCGQYIVTSTCSPRLRVNNGFRIFHYTATMVQEWMAPEGCELFQVRWQPNPALSKPFTIDYKPIKGLTYGVKTSSAKRYIPPSQRAAQEKHGGVVDDVKRFLSEREQPSSAYIDPKVAEKKERRKQKKEQEKLKKEEEQQKKEEERGDWRKPKTEEEVEKEKLKLAKKEKQNNKPPPTEDEAAMRTKTNRTRNLRKKLESIAELKKERDAGKELLKGQLDKISTEKKLLQEMEMLKVS